MEIADYSRSICLTLIKAIAQEGYHSDNGQQNHNQQAHATQ